MSEAKVSKLQERLNAYLTIVVLTLVVIVPLVSCGLLYLSNVPDVSWASEDGLTLTRIWMYRERRPLGIGYQSQRMVREYSSTEVCAETRLRFFLWGNSRLVKPSTTPRQMILIDDQWQTTGEKCR